MQVYNFQSSALAQTVLQQGGDTFLTDTILSHADGLDLVVGRVCVAPSLHRVGLKSVATADDSLEVGYRLAILASLLFLSGKSCKGLGDEGSSSRTKTVVVQDEMLQGHVLREEWLQGSDRPDAESIVG